MNLHPLSFGSTAEAVSHDLPRQHRPRGVPLAKAELIVPKQLSYDLSDDPWMAPDPALALALQQVRYYARNGTRFRRLYRASEILILLTTATTTVVAALGASAWVTATLAASTVVLTGMNRIVDTHDRYIASVGAWAELQVAVNDYRLLPEEQRDEEARQRLVAKVNQVLKADTERWASRRQNILEPRDQGPLAAPPTGQPSPVNATSPDPPHGTGT